MRRSARKRIVGALLAAVTAVAVVTSPAEAAPPADYCGGQCNDILPPGENGNATLADILGNKLFGTRPAHTDDQLGPYAALANDYQSVTNDTIDQYFNSSAFGVPPDQVASSIQPRSDVSIVRDKATGVPHVYGTTRSGTEFGAGYAAAQDRLWLMDLFRHVGRGQLTSFAGGAEGNRQLEQTFWAAAPYTEQDLQDQVNRIAASGPAGAQALTDINAYLDGVNTYIRQAYQGRYFPGEYVLTGHVDAITNAGSIDPFQATDLIAIAGVVGALFGTGGGGEVQSALVKQAAEAKYGPALGEQVWQSFREENDPEATLTVHSGQSFPYAASPANPEGVALPDAGSVRPQQEVYDPTGSAVTNAKAPVAAPASLAPAKGIFDNGVLPGNLLSDKHGMSNALVVSGQHTDDGHPLAVFGPQTGYFAPQLLMLEELQGPGISARGVSFAGTNFYVQLGRGQDYAWSATSASQDITDTFALQLCNPDGSAPGPDSTSYVDNGQCVPMEPLEVRNSWKPTIADTTAAGSYRLVEYRTRYGLVQYRATVGGKPVAYAAQRSTYRHEADSILGFQKFNDPAQMGTAAQFEAAAADINYTFNWFYVNSSESAYYNSGWNPVRPSTVDPNLPVLADPRYEWLGWDPALNTSQRTPDSAHPSSVDQDYYVSWNNKQARDYTSAGFGEASVHRVDLLDSRLSALVARGNVSRADVVRAMEDAAVTDLRGEDVLPTLLRVIDTRPVTDPAQAAAVSQLRTWLAHGAKRVETSPGSRTYADATAIQVMDAWWPLLVQAEFQPAMGNDLFTALVGALQINESPSNGQTGPTSGGASANESAPHRGSAFQHGWWSYVDKDLRAVLGEPVAGGLAQPYCGGGNLAACRTALLASLAQAAAEPATTVYPADDNCSAGQQWCADSIVQRPMGGITDPAIGWQNRPTFQQVVQFTGHR
ncbi:acyl-homoserine lactone acylase PvdQ [Amycolatopsis bartoniae]|uniref:Penicillin acylase n=1 Tax=Amycolatopsis bartoniae TaxID=941986 RepID=A0A8H9INE2_9PSEU|nr:penicillin acylase family protein [Amycolatopsis bartoniae]MBB2939308.1 acyl-homoserine lactone acylase PvdQ [Amycolatopsis bartoniae]TVT08760.1 penicillin acylase family protein [Amycolatopsis bartoniae]GHF37415.1 penicillin acylase [Amycolatopsis bartoniae]